MTTPTRSGIMAFKEETTEGDLETPLAADFVPIRDGFSFTGELESIDSDEFVDDIGPSKCATRPFFDTEKITDELFLRSSKLL